MSTLKDTCEDNLGWSNRTTEITDDCEDNLGWVYPFPPSEEPAPGLTIVTHITQLVNGQSYIQIVFDIVQVPTWEFINLQVFNTTDLTPLDIRPGIVTAKSTTGFTLQFNGLPDSNNYFLNWSFTGTGGGSPPPAPPIATAYSLSGPTSGAISVASTNFTVALIGGGVASPVTITPAASSGTFTPTTVTLSTGSPSATFTYTPSSYGAKTISTTNGGGLTDPANLTYTSVASTYTLTGPSSGSNGVPSTNFTVALPAGGVLLSAVTITPNDSSGGGSFTPTTVNLTTGAPSATFTYTPASSGTKTIATTNSGTLTNPSGLSYSVIGPIDPSTIAGLKFWLKADALALSDGTAVTTWNDSSTNGYNPIVTGGPIFKTAIVNGKPIVRFNGANNLHGPSDIGISQPFTVIAVGNQTATTANFAYFWTDLPSIFVLQGTPNVGNFYMTTATAGAAMTDAVNRSGAFHVASAVFNGASSAAYFDRVSVGTGNMGTTGVGTVYIMTNNSGSFDSVGDLAEVLIYNSALSNANRLGVELWLQAKYATP